MEKEKSRSKGAREHQGSFTLFVDFLSLFNNHGKAIDAFVPKKLRKEATNRFGLVKYSTSEEAQRAILIGNGASLGDKQLVVKWARFPRMETHHSVEVNSKAPHLKEDQRGSRLNCPTARGDSKLHGKAFQHKSIPYNSKEAKTNQQYSLPSFVGEKKTLSAVGDAGDGHSAEALQNTIIAEGFNDVLVRPMGGNKYLLTFSSEESMVDTLKNYAQFLMVWFKLVKQWGKFDVSAWRKTWISCYGLPLHLRSSENFSMIAQIWGKLLPLILQHLIFYLLKEMCILTDSMSSIVEEIIIKEGQHSHIVSIRRDGCLGIPLLYSPTKVNVMKGGVMTREDALAIDASSSPVPNLINKEPFPVTPLLPGLVLEIGPNIVPTPQQVVSNVERIVPVASEEPSLGLDHSSSKEHSKKKKVKKRLRQGKNVRRGSLATKRRDSGVAKAADLGLDGKQPSFKPKELDSEKPMSNCISPEDLFEFAEKLGVPFMGDEETYGDIRS
ncbi:LOW QUALITY PROTEIN: hypothetical protein Cgig2_001990 [Carnegiea gigantea]|uniref:RRM domain-containing protein n=1 Tax=Carnegiea gigantea TaxID=171969 RepID=A0A9Q1GPL2_9CARY|nr:LOW QUALITY PROTEIN: hypothetical protein Cgig2_001990 [Carnegiea gigantea]